MPMPNTHTNWVDHDDPHNNMFGIQPCPRCGDEHRWPTQSDHFEHPNAIICDMCEFVEPRARCEICNELMGDEPGGTHERCENDARGAI
jgi:hypothetical protein